MRGDCVISNVILPALRENQSSTMEKHEFAIRCVRRVLRRIASDPALPAGISPDIEPYLDDLDRWYAHDEVKLDTFIGTRAWDLLRAALVSNYAPMYVRELLGDYDSLQKLKEQSLEIGDFDNAAKWKHERDRIATKIKHATDSLELVVDRKILADSLAALDCLPAAVPDGDDG